jgi:hypothetical protein
MTIGGYGRRSWQYWVLGALVSIATLLVLREFGIVGLVPLVLVVFGIELFFRRRRRHVSDQLYWAERANPAKKPGP